MVIIKSIITCSRGIIIPTSGNMIRVLLLVNIPSRGIKPASKDAKSL